ncbi:tetratricopeptide repeat protein [Tundrisphaera sp. TA3]|uniref:tetratricopeptide repeat protein n=1 Tax=Tundrisphaera sp. TA3 TaxID=3435775 RepID=UPI003EBD19DB
MSEPASPRPDPSPSTPRRSNPARGILIAVAALGICAFAGRSIYQQAREIWPSPPPAAPPVQAQRSLLADGSLDLAGSKLLPEHTSRLVIGKDGGHAVVSVGRCRYNPASDESQGRQLLENEMFRQAVLMAARDGLGAIVRDEIIGDEIASPEGARILEIHYRLPSYRRAHLSIREGDKILWGRIFTVGTPSPPLLTPLVTTLDELARGPLKEALAKIGVPAKRAAARPSGAAAEAIEADLGRMSFASQFSALRSLHEASRVEGESPERLAALARGYANLGLLTTHHWSPTHRAYEARSLLYAERLNAIRPGEPLSLWTRGYARGLVGLHRFALEDLKLAEEKRKALPEPRRPIPPDWVDLIDRRVRFDVEGLLAACQDPKLAPLASVLAAMTVEHSRAQAQTLRVTLAAQQASPDNLWIMDASSNIGKLGHLHLATVQGMNLTSLVVPRDLKRVAGLPDSVAKALDGSEGEVAVLKAMAEAGAPGRDAGEPSWSALAKMGREARFAPVARRVNFMVSMWNVPVDELLEQVRPLVSDHTFWPLLELYASDIPPRDRAQLVAAIQAIPAEEIEATETLLYRTLLRVNQKVGMDCFREMMGHPDQIERDYATVATQSRPTDAQNHARALNFISPYSPLGAALLVESSASSLDEDWNADPMARHARHPEYLAARGVRLAAEKKTAEAEAMLRTAIELSPDRSTYRALASAFKEAGKMDEWQATLDKFLEEESTGLDHAQVQVELANHFMEQKDWDKALPYAEAAAETWAGWAMACAIRCHEGRKDWEKAELWARRLSERYDNSSAAWFNFCWRSGRGDIIAAGDLMAQHVLADPDNAGPGELDLLATYFLLLKEPGRARDAYETLLKGLGDGEDDRAYRAITSIKLATLADELGDAPGRDRALEVAVENMVGKAPLFTAITRSIQAGLQAPAGTPLDLTAIDQALDEMAVDDSGLVARANISFAVGRFAEMHGRKQEALKYFGYCTQPSTPNRPLALAALRDRGVKVGPDGEL